MRDFPYGRGFTLGGSEPNVHAVVANSENHLLVECNKYGSDIKGAFEEACRITNKIEEFGGKFARNEHLGFITSSPSNLGTGMTAQATVYLASMSPDQINKLASTHNLTAIKHPEWQEYYNVSTTRSLGHTEVEIINGMEPGL